jgi:hypothetical protein
VDRIGFNPPLGHFAKVFGDGLSETAMSKQDFVRLKDDITESLPEDDLRERVFDRIEILNPDNTSATAPDHTKLYAAKADKPAYQQARAVELKNLACSGDSFAASIVPVIELGILATGPFASQLAADILACLSASNLAEPAKTELQQIERDAAAKSFAQAGEAAPSTAQNKRHDIGEAGAAAPRRCHGHHQWLDQRALRERTASKENSHEPICRT